MNRNIIFKKDSCYLKIDIFKKDSCYLKIDDFFNTKIIFKILDINETFFKIIEIIKDDYSIGGRIDYISNDIFQEWMLNYKLVRISKITFYRYVRKFNRHNRVF